MFNSLAEYFESFLAAALGHADFPEEVRQIIRDTFYAGATAGHMMCRGRSRKEAAVRVKRLQAELKEHRENVLQDMPNATERTQ